MTREQLFRYFFLGVFLFLIFQVLHILSPFYTGILGAIVLTLISFPLHRLILRLIGRQRVNAAAAISTTLVIVLIVIPFIFSSWLLLKEMKTLQPVIERLSDTVESWREGKHFIESPGLKVLEIKLQAFLDIVQVDLKNVVVGSANHVIRTIASFGKKLPKNTFIFVINMLIMIFTLFFLFRDGQSLFRRIKELIPMDNKHKDHITNQLYITLTAVVRGVFLVAITQGILATLGFFMARVPSPLVLGFVTMILALIPLVGAASVWVPVCLYYFVQGAALKGIFLALWGVLVVSLVDNFLRPILIGSKAKLPVLFLFFGILGGVKVYGPLGLFLGPLVIALVLAFIRIYKEEFQQGSRNLEEPK